MLVILRLEIVIGTVGLRILAVKRRRPGLSHSWFVYGDSKEQKPRASILGSTANNEYTALVLRACCCILEPNQIWPVCSDLYPYYTYPFSELHIIMQTMYRTVQ